MTNAPMQREEGNVSEVDEREEARTVQLIRADLEAAKERVRRLTAALDEVERAYGLRDDGSSRD